MVAISTGSSQEDEQIARLEAEEIDLIVLARYMQILTDSFVAKYPERIINKTNGITPRRWLQQVGPTPPRKIRQSM